MLYIGVLKRQLRYVKGVELSDALLYNIVQGFRREVFGYGTPEETARLLNKLKTQGKLSALLSDESRLVNAVFVSEQSQKAVAACNGCYANVVCVDATHSTNR